MKVRKNARKAEVSYFHGDLPSLLMHGSRPPGVIDSEAQAQSNEDQSPATLVWAADPRSFGREGAKTVFEYGPAFTNPDAALSWLATPAGAAWDKDAVNRFLLSAMQVQGSFPQPDIAPCSGSFPEADWHEEFRFKHLQVLPNPVFEHQDLQLEPPAHYVNGHDEQAELLRLASLRQAQHKQIYTEAQGGVNAAYPVLHAAGWDSDVWPVTPRMLAIKALRQAVLASVELSVFKFKTHYCRARPWTIYPAVRPMFRNHDHKCYPGHPSFPSGHATVAYAFAYLIPLIDRNANPIKLEAVAEAVARRREIAGVHFPATVPLARTWRGRWWT